MKQAPPGERSGGAFVLATGRRRASPAPRRTRRWTARAGRIDSARPPDRSSAPTHRWPSTMTVRDRSPFAWLLPVALAGVTIVLVVVVVLLLRTQRQVA